MSRAPDSRMCPQDRLAMEATYALTSKGKLREPRFVRVRADKNANQVKAIR